MFRRKAKENTQIIRIHPVSIRDHKLCRAEAWGAEGYNFCPFLRRGICTVWGFNTERRPDKVAGCPVTEVVIPLPSD